MITLIGTILLHVVIINTNVANIEDLQVGDWVYSYDTTTGVVSQRAVTQTIARTGTHINRLTIVDESGLEQTHETTDVHPFWVVTDTPDLTRAARKNAEGMLHENLGSNESGYWVETKDLQVGDIFLGINGERSTLTNIVRIEQEGGIAVFNFTVEGNHNYFILAKNYSLGQASILVHNSWKCTQPFLIDPKDIRYSQDSIKRSISGPSGTIDNLRDGLRNGTINPKDIPTIKIHRDPFTGEIYSLDNRRLWAAKEAGTKINAQWATAADLHKAAQLNKTPARLTINVINK